MDNDTMPDIGSHAIMDYIIKNATAATTEIASTEETWGDDESPVLFFSLTQLGWILPTTSASISFVFSVLVISFISRSQDLSSSYHRIMLFMSSWDVVSSLAIALTTVPMPSDVHDVYPFANGAFGSTLTCTIQGFAIILGAIYTVWSNVALNIYYVCTIRFGMSEETLNRRILPLMLGANTILVCILSYIGSSLEIVNPRPFEPYCLVGSYPHDCVEKESVECIRGDVTMSTARSLRITFIIIIGLSFFCIVTSLLLVVEAVFKTEIRWRQDYGRENVSLINTRTAMHQAVMYIGAFFLTWVWFVATVSTTDEATTQLLTPLKLFFLPLQGFFNAAIFFSNKVSILRKADPRLTRFAAFRQTILSPSTVPRMLLSQMSAMVHGSLHSLDCPQEVDGDAFSSELSSGLPSGVSIPSNNTPSHADSWVLSLGEDMASASRDPDNISSAGRSESANGEESNNPHLEESHRNINADSLSSDSLQVIEFEPSPPIQVSEQMPSYQSQSGGEVGGDGSSCFFSDESSTSSVMHLFRRGALGRSDASNFSTL